MIKIKFLYNDLQVNYINIKRENNSFEDHLLVKTDLSIFELQKHDKKTVKL